MVLYSLYLDLETYRPAEVSKEYDLMYCGRLVPNKGLFILLAALKILKKKRVSAGILIRRRSAARHAPARKPKMSSAASSGTIQSPMGIRRAVRWMDLRRSSCEKGIVGI